MCLSFAAHADDTPPPADAGQVGRSIFVANQVDGKGGEAPAKHIAVNDDIVFKEDITTGSDAKAVIEFRDGSTFEVGPDAAVRIDSFIFNPEESTSHKALQVTRGVFRYVSAYVASDQNTTISTPNGQTGIRGSVAEGVVDPALPDFIYLGEGSATFTNSAGSSALQAGNSIAAPSAATPPMAPDAMPAAVAAQTVQAIENRLPPRTALANRPAADDAWLKRAGAADLVPVAEQQQRQARAAARPLPAASPAGGLAAEFGLLGEANRVNLFVGRQTARTPEQAAFLARAARENPNAAATMRRFTTDASALHRAAMTTGTAFVIRGVGHAAPSAEVMRRVTAAAVRANPGAAGLIRHHAGESYRGADRGELNRPGHQPNAFGRRPANENARQPSERHQPADNARPPNDRHPQREFQQQRQAPQRQPARPRPQGRQPGEKKTPKKPGNSDQNQNGR